LLSLAAKLTLFVAQMMYKWRRSDAQTVLSQICLWRGRCRQETAAFLSKCTKETKEENEEHNEEKRSARLSRVLIVKEPNGDNTDVLPNDMIISCVSTPLNLRM